MFLKVCSNIRFPYFSFLVSHSVFVERWQKIALLVFSVFARVSAKTKCAICAVGFFCMAYNSFISLIFLLLSTHYCWLCAIFQLDISLLKPE